MAWSEPGGWVVTRGNGYQREALWVPGSPGLEAQWCEWWDGTGLGPPKHAARATSKREAERWAKQFDGPTRVQYIKPNFQV